ncbi:MAG: S8 family peptidase [Bacteroidales bacterium]|nr:S8 family peptidase [Bacteroidales bacterium]
MRKKILSLIFIVIIFSNYIFSQNNAKYLENRYIPATIIFKVKPEYNQYCKLNKIEIKEIESILKSINVKSLYKKFPSISAPKSKYNQYGQVLIDLSTIYELEYSSDLSMNKVLFYFNSLEIIEYAQAHFLPELLEVPDDNYNVSNQYYLENIMAYQAWDISKGDTNIIIGIIDTGVDIDHEDLIDNIKYNYNDPINGIDDDNDGFTDNFRGWDLGENDNNPQSNANHHGVGVSGIAAATTNNSTGISGVSYNCKFLPVKISDEEGNLTMSYEGIVYAAEHGCNIINCSWGGTNKNPYGQDIVNYATYNKNCLVVAACGNNGDESVFYPASFENVISVAATDVNDIKWTGSNYGIYIDISAPGSNIYLTKNDNSYGSGWGTSYASPIISGSAAIIKSFYPQLTALQIGELLKVSTDIIDTITENISYSEKLGSGRINLYKALTNSFKPSVKFNDVDIIYQNDYLLPNDTIIITGTFNNYLSQVSNTTISLSCESPNIEFINNSFYIDTLKELETITNKNNPFIIKILPEILFNEKISINIYSSPINYLYNQFVDFIANKTYINFETSQIQTTVTSNGRIGYNDFYNNEGVGFIYKDKGNFLYEAGIIVGNSTENVVSCIKGDNDFTIISKINKINDSLYYDFHYQSIFDDSLAEDNEMNINIILDTYAWDDEENSNFVIINYKIINKNNYDIENLFTGIFADWDIIDANRNKIDFDEEHNLSYTYSNLSDIFYTGIKLLSNTPVKHYAIDNIQGGNGGVDITNGFSTEEKYFVLTNNRHNAGGLFDGNDVADVLSTGPISIAVGDTVEIGFVLIAAENLYNLKQAGENAQNKYKQITSCNKNLKPDIIENDINIFPNPTNESINITCNNLDFKDFAITLYNIEGNIVSLINNITYRYSKHIVINCTNLPKGIYFIKLEIDNKSYNKKIVVIH